MYEAGATGKYERMTWDSDSRAVVMAASNGKDRLVIDTSSHPPQKRLERDGLALSQEIDAMSLEQKQYQTLQEQEQIQSSQHTTNMERVWDDRRDEYSLRGESTDNLYGQFATENQATQDAYEQLEKQLAQGDMNDTEKADAIDRMITLTQEMQRNNQDRKQQESIDPPETMDNLMEKAQLASDRGTIDQMLRVRIASLTQSLKSIQSLDDTRRRLAVLQDKDGIQDRFDEVASSNLDWLISR